MIILKTSQDAVSFAKEATEQQMKELEQTRRQLLSTSSFIITQAQFCREAIEHRNEIERKKLEEAKKYLSCQQCGKVS